MTSAPGGFRAPRSARSGWRQQLRQALVAQMPANSRRRAVAVATRDTVQDLSETAQSVRRHWAAASVVDVPAPPYPVWRRRHRPSVSDLAAQRDWADGRAGAPDLRIVVLPGPGDLAATVASLYEQSSPRWRAFVPGQARYDDPRIDMWAQDSELTTWLDGAGRAMTLMLRPGDTLAPDCVYQVALAAHRSPGLELVTWDDDVVSGHQHHTPRFRPSWSPELLLAEDYVGRAFAMRASTILRAGGLTDPVAASATWDLLLRADPPSDRVGRVARVLSSAAGRTAIPEGEAMATVQRHLERQGLPGRTVPGALGGVRVVWELPEWPRVTVVIPTRHNQGMMSTCLRSVATSDYPHLEIVVVDNGERTIEHELWYSSLQLTVPLHVLWWDRPFNYSAVNNLAAAHGRGDVLVFLNDDTEVRDPSWLRELVGWAMQPDVGMVGLRLTGQDGKIQHEGVIVGMSGFADHVFAGMPPGSDSIYGPTDRLRNVLAVTGACCAVRRTVFDELGGFDERFQLTGSDVALGLSAVLAGRRNVCSPHVEVRHLESATRGTTVPRRDYFTSYWRYNPWLFRGDPYWNPNLSLRHRRPTLRGKNESSAVEHVGRVIGRDLKAYRQRSDEGESVRLARMCRVTDVDVDRIRAEHARYEGRVPVRTVNWFLPEIDSPFYGGVNTALRIADLLAREHGVENRFVVWATPAEEFVRSALAAAFPALADAQIVFHDESLDLDAVPPADAGVATLWTTAYALARAPGMARRFYLVQDFEPMFYPAGTQYALAEETYRLGFYGICNTDNLRRVYQDDYGGQAMSFVPAVDTSVFHAKGRLERQPEDPVTVFAYARPGHWRNCWEVAAGALTELKRRLGDRVHIVTAGARATGSVADDVMEHLGLLDYRATGTLYRSSDVGLALTVSRHPSYLPLELMACGVPVVAFDNPWGHWLLRDGENSLLSQRTVDSLADHLERLCRDAVLRRELAESGLADIAARHDDWDSALAGIYDWLCDPGAPVRDR